MQCYKEFAYIYDKLIKEDIDYKKWANVIIDICEKFNIEKRNYLDLACGTGNITIEIGKKFFNTWGIDLSADMLTEADSKLRKQGLKAKFVCSDICDFKLNRQFNLITCCLDSINYILEEDSISKLFCNVYNHLKDDGIFIFDINSYYKLTEILGNNTFNYEDDSIVYIWDNYKEEDTIYMYLTFFIKEGELYRRFDEEHVERAYKEYTIDYLLKKNNLNILYKLENYQCKKIKENTERVVYVVKKG
ncbi:dTDP-3-amino-3,4,6-trideoxy-alpha-D-glucopyranose [Clostridium acetireducens DSM 10703]|uniref:dTDP-3-amino-3,4, 6-trideoxy-alpha-D-glucopyranose n=1 Tax=Clostridium acetireducens DSM 10703 TaxID=1121290 RepID=A0A1E8EYS5_9CLOT|nr:class I SAM-dependent methyltransferase [Clostridium acetireducens]OFI06133.1 dTDP-3-amino-3,4,6-trideoxy-alpha-D-glucopyranose [Clostridium acetireducens DSM 10703]